MVKNLPANVGASGVLGSIPGLGRPSGGGKGNPLPWRRKWQHSGILAGIISWTEEAGGLQSMGLQSQTRLKRPSTAHTAPCTCVSATLSVHPALSFPRSVAMWMNLEFVMQSEVSQKEKKHIIY